MERKLMLIIEAVFLLTFIAMFAFYYPSLLLIGITLGVMLVIIFGSLLQGSMDVYYCPNELCPYVEKLERGKKCPACGTEARKFGVRQSIDLLKEKHNPRNRTSRKRIGKIEAK